MRRRCSRPADGSLGMLEYLAQTTILRVLCNTKSMTDTVADEVDKNITIGVLALQGDVEQHMRLVNQCGVKAIAVRFPHEIDQIEGLIIPGGESTTVGKLMARYGLDKKIIERAQAGMPIFGTCTGMILLAKSIVSSEQHRLGLMDMVVLRNAFGRQVESFEADIDVEPIGPPPVRAVFIRAPYAVEVGGGADILARYDDKSVLVRQNNLLACAFHPELTEDTRIHQYFTNMVREWASASQQPSEKPRR